MCFLLTAAITVALADGLKALSTLSNSAFDLFPVGSAEFCIGDFLGGVRVCFALGECFVDVFTSDDFLLDWPATCFALKTLTLGF